MNLNNSLNIKRLSQLLKNDLLLHRKMILIIACTLAVIFTLLPLDVSDTGAYFLLLYVGGFIITSLAFNDLHDNAKAAIFLTLPCSNLERLVSKWLLTGIIYALSLLILYVVFSALNAGISAWRFGGSFTIVDIFQTDVWFEIGKYIILQSIILLGAICFKRYTLIKTCLALACLALIISILSGIIAWIFCPGCTHYDFAFHYTHHIIGLGFWIILAPFCWYITYLKLTEFELK